MFKLIKLECRKNRIGKWVRNAAIMTAFLIPLIITSGEAEFDGAMERFGMDAVVLSVDLFTNLCYIVFTGVMIASFIVNAYENKTIQLMFSYPIKRQKILLAKIITVWTFNFSALFFSKSLLYLTLLLTQPYTHISTQGIQISNLSFWCNVIFGSAAMVSISFIALLAGMKMRSSKAAVIAAVLVASFTQGNIGDYTLVGNIPFYCILLVLAFACVVFSIYNAETKDV